MLGLRTHRTTEQQPTHASQGGFSTIGMIIFAAIALAGTVSTIRILGYNATYLKIVRMNQRLEFMEVQIRNAARSNASLYESAVRMPGTDLNKCLAQPGGSCLSGEPQPLALRNSGSMPLTGFFTLSGKHCSQDRPNCVIGIEMTYKISCQLGAVCNAPDSIAASYRIFGRYPAYFKGRQFKERTGTVDTNLFTCPSGTFLQGFQASGTPLCVGAALHPGAYKPCDGSTRALGILPNGNMECEPTVNFCLGPSKVELIIDSSGSMKSPLAGTRTSKMDHAKNFAHGLLAGKRDKDEAGLIAFNSDVGVTTARSTNVNSLLAKVDGLKAGGGTNISAALQKGAKDFAADDLIVDTAKSGTDLADDINRKCDPARGENPVIVMITDGAHNTGKHPKFAAADLHDRCAQIFTVGIGVSVNYQREIARYGSRNKFVHDKASLDAALAEIRDLIFCGGVD